MNKCLQLLQENLHSRKEDERMENVYKSKRTNGNAYRI